jgi:hypothetical protein
MTNSNPSKADPKAAIIVFGRQHAEGLPQAAWFRTGDAQAAKASAAEMKFAVIELKSDTERALAIGVHEGVLKGSGRMIVGAVEPEVYRLIEEHFVKQSSPATLPKPAEAPPVEPSTIVASATKSGADATTAPGSSISVAPNPTRAWQSLQPGDSVLTLYRNEKREPEGWWVATVARIEKNEFILRWPNEPDFPVFRRTPKYVAILHPDFIPSGE